MKSSWKLDPKQDLQKLFRERCADKEFQAAMQRGVDQSLIINFERRKKVYESIISNHAKS